MKKIKEIVGLILVLLITLCSCTNDSSDSMNEVLMLKKIVEVAVDGSANTTSIVYDGNKIVNIDKVDKTIRFYYSSNLIEKVETLDKKTQHLNTLNYTYSVGQLTKITSSDKYVINYIHNSDGTVSYEKLTKDSNNIDVKNYHGVLYFQNENLLKDERIIDDAGKGVLIKNTSSFKYDSKNNALKNILGFNKLLDYATAISSNNVVTTTIVSSVTYTNEGQAISSAERIDSKCEYNSNNYPSEIVSEKVFFGDSDSNHLKSQLFYN